MSFGIRARNESRNICSRIELIRFALKITLCRLAIDLHFTAMIREMNRPNCETTAHQNKKMSLPLIARPNLIRGIVQ